MESAGGIHFRRGKPMHGEENATAVGGLPKASALTGVSRHFAGGTRLFILLFQLVEI